MIFSPESFILCTFFFFSGATEKRVLLGAELAFACSSAGPPHDGAAALSPAARAAGRPPPLPVRTLQNKTTGTDSERFLLADLRSSEKNGLQRGRKKMSS